MKELREKVDEIDDEIFDLLMKRFELTDKIGVIKVKKGLPLDHEVEREEYIISRLIQKYPQFFDELYKVIFDEAIRRQKLNK